MLRLVVTFFREYESSPDGSAPCFRILDLDKDFSSPFGEDNLAFLGKALDNL